jgi:hypothetical protein
LKEATAELDEVTKLLADHAMEAMLRKRGLIPPEAGTETEENKGNEGS